MHAPCSFKCFRQQPPVSQQQSLLPSRLSSHPACIRRIQAATPVHTTSSSAAASTSASASSSSSPSSSRSGGTAIAGLDMIRTTRPVDRLRYQARLIFDAFDSDADGVLSQSEFQAYLAHSDARLGQLPGLAERYAALAVADAGFEDFVELVRAQVAAAAASREWAQAQLPTRELSRLLFKAALPIPELASALAVFRLLSERGGDGTRVRVDTLRAAQGIEKVVFDDVLEDADTDEDGLLTFEDFLTSYHKERPVFMSMAVMLAHTAVFWMLFQLPIDTMLKVLVAGLLLLKPAIVTAPVVHVWTIGKTVWGRIVAAREMAGRQGWGKFA